MRIDVGNLDRRISIYKKIETENELGEIEQNTEKVATVWSEVKGMRGYEKMDKVGNISSKEILRVVIRYRNGIDVATEIEYKKKRYDITSVVELGREEYVELMCEGKDKKDEYRD